MSACTCSSQPTNGAQQLSANVAHAQSTNFMVQSDVANSRL